LSSFPEILKKLFFFLFSKLINFAVPDTIDPRVINLGSKLSLFKKHENLTLAINSAQVFHLALVYFGGQKFIQPNFGNFLKKFYNFFSKAITF